MGVIAKYKFNNTLEANLLPEFNSEFTSDLYTVTDEVNGEVTTRTIESDSLPTLMRFGNTYVSGLGATNKSNSLLEVVELDASELISTNSMFACCSNVTNVVLNNFNKVLDMHDMFYFCTSLISCNSNEWDTSNVIIMFAVFSGCINLIEADVSNWDTSKSLDMGALFNNCNNLVSLDVSNFDTSQVTNMNYMFHDCENLTTLDVSNWDTSNVINMESMFYNCNKLTTLDVSNWDTSKVTNMQQMFRLCGQLIELDANNWNTSKVQDMYAMFNSCSSLTSLNVSNWDTSGLISTPELFYNCSKLTSLNLSKWDTSNVVGMGYMFSNCTNLTTLDVSNFDTNKVITMTDMFAGTTNLKYLKCNNVSTLNTLNTLLPTKTSTSQGTIICKSDITNLDIATLQSKYWNILDEPTLIAKYVFDKSIHNNCIPEFNTEFEGYFIEDEVVEGSNEVTRTIESCGMLPTLMIFGSNLDTYVEGREVALLEILNMNTSGLTSCGNMFRYCKNLTSITCEWDTSNVTAMSYMFRNCKLLTPLDVSNWDTSNVTTMRDMFYGCNKLTSLDVSNWNTSNVTNMAYMFSGCSNLITLDVSNWNTSNVIYIHAMFTNCSNLTSLDISNWNTSNVTNTTNMFSNTPLLTDISVLYMDKSNLQKLVDAMPTDSNKTLWYKDVNIDGITHGDNITLKKYMEENVEIVLNSPLLEGDTIEVKDGKLCHVHRYEKVVLDGSENWQSPHNFFWIQKKYLPSPLKEREAKKDSVVFVDTLIHGYIDNNTANQISTNRLRLAIQDTGNGGTNIRIILKDIKDNDIDGLKQWLQANPTTVVYELETPYYEDITNLQSAPTLKTYLECSMEIDTDLPIDTNVTYRTNLSSVYVMERELDELDNGIDLGDILEGEVNE